MTTPQSGIAGNAGNPETPYGGRTMMSCYDGNTSVNGAACPTNPPVAPFKGRLTSVSSSASTSTTTAIDSFGNITGSRHTTGGVNYNFTYGYEALAAISSGSSLQNEPLAGDIALYPCTAAVYSRWELQAATPSISTDRFVRAHPSG